jgi:hypothetical protein
MNGNTVSRRLQLNNLAIGNITAETTLAVDVTVPSGAVETGDVGFAIPTVEFTEGLPGIIPCLATSATNLRLFFVNPQDGDVDPADTFDFRVMMFPQTGNLDVTV